MVSSYKINTPDQMKSITKLNDEEQKTLIEAYCYHPYFLIDLLNFLSILSLAS